MDDAGKLTGGTAPHRKPAAKWLSIAQLVRTGIEIFKVSRYAKSQERLVEIARAPGEFYQLSNGTKDVRVDFVADTGDGFEPTFATALCVARHPELPENEPRADLLVLGGDLVYPVAKESRYEERFTSVFKHAAELAGMTEKPPIVALPGNHDWYDGLKSFLKMMGIPAYERAQPSPEPNPIPISAGPDVGGWSAFQSRSYFAIQLTEDWWLWGVDSQLDAPIDDDQVEYFKQAQKKLNGADVILCTATPSWLEAAGTEPHRADEGSPFDSLLDFIDKALGEKRNSIRLLLTGDKHHYAHYVPKNGSGFGPHLVTCGGGGAFLSATHHLPEALHPVWRPRSADPASTEYELAKVSPTAIESKTLVANGKFLAAGVRNGPTLPILAGGVGACLFGMFHWGLVPVLISAGVLTGLLGLYANRGKHKHKPKFRTGLALAVSHMLGHVGVAGLTEWIYSKFVPLDFWPSLLAAFPVLAVLGAGVFVTYLHIADRFGWHTLEAFSGMRIERYKCHLRMVVGQDGITMSVVGLNPPSAGQASHTTTLPPQPEIIEEFKIERRGTATQPPEDAVPALRQ